MAKLNKEEVLGALKVNREMVISYFNDEVQKSWNITLKDFMADVLSNFKKANLAPTIGKFDVYSNCCEAKSRLGVFDNKVEVFFDRDEYIKRKYSNTAFAQNLAL